MATQYITDLRKTIDRLFISGQLDKDTPCEIGLSVIEFLAKESESHCNGITYEISDTLKEINGMKIDFGGGFSKIFISSGLNYCWSRFTIAKEICNIIMDGTSFHKYETEIPSNLLSQLSALKPEPDEGKDSGYYPDLLAELGACELLLPCQYAVHALGLSKAYGNHAVATYYGIPEKWVERRFDELIAFF